MKNFVLEPLIDGNAHPMLAWLSFTTGRCPTQTQAVRPRGPKNALPLLHPRVFDKALYSSGAVIRFDKLAEILSTF